MYREYTWQRDTAGERHHSSMYREYSTDGREILLVDREYTDSTDNRAHSILAATGPYLV